MNLSTIRRPRRASENRKRVGRGMGSGMGKTSTRGHKGQGSRSGSRLLRGFEGGQMPLHRRLPKRGFTNIFRVEYRIINLDRLAGLGEKNITQEFLVKQGLAGKNDLIKVLGDGEVKHDLKVQVDKISATAREKIEKAGGTVTLRETRTEKRKADNASSAAKPKAAVSKDKPPVKKTKSRSKKTE